MKHFNIEDWTDLARGQTGLEKSSVMHKHLADGCNRCSQLFHLFQNVASVAERETSYEPPEAAVLTAKRLYALHGPKTITTLMEEKPKLLFDSLQQPFPVGVRTSGRSTRQLLYQAGNFLLDLYREVKPDSNHVLLMGQVLRYGEPPSEAKNVPVVLIKGNKKCSPYHHRQIRRVSVRVRAQPQPPPRRGHQRTEGDRGPSSSLKTPPAKGRAGEKKRRARARGEQ